jgi:hypothetical protein
MPGCSPRCRAAPAVVNLARGAHLVDADLLAALDSGHLSHAVLDVFHAEPLPPTHPFWSPMTRSPCCRMWRRRPTPQRGRGGGGQPARGCATARRSRTAWTAAGATESGPAPASGARRARAPAAERAQRLQHHQHQPLQAVPGVGGQPGWRRPLTRPSHTLAASTSAPAGGRPAAAPRVRTAFPSGPRRAPPSAPAAAGLPPSSAARRTGAARGCPRPASSAPAPGLAFGAQAVEHAQRTRHLAARTASPSLKTS